MDSTNSKKINFKLLKNKKYISKVLKFIDGCQVILKSSIFLYFLFFSSEEFSLKEINK